ncbi:MAG: asparagine synthetase B [Flavobacteriales bacterium TMED288]|nr:asparagine synthetase B [Flavobacteriales bacterium]MAJ98914.1 asparagine synthetase B [Flavobacteriales bacterium]RPG53649.1 MAG: asparagine synthetase B [Flavobacteriales bacterium TMED288]|tara:strand:- start:4708 stop:5964 length:1257 start_codon:yes stop_codon:yes gene_type:complete
MKIIFYLIIILSCSIEIFGTNILIPMNNKQKNHLKAYGIAYFSLQKNMNVDWLLNFKGGSFLINYNREIEKVCILRNVSFEIVSDDYKNEIIEEINLLGNNADIVKLETYPKIAVYSPKENQPWDDAVTLVLSYAEIPYDVIYDEEILSNILPIYDWLHLHHEDFTGQYGKFYFSFKNTPWYIDQKRSFENRANLLGFNKVSKQKLAVSLKIKEFLFEGGFLFAMCSATDSYDICLSAENLDICDYMFDGDGLTKNNNEKLNYENTIAFENFKLIENPNIYEFSDIDVTRTRKIDKNADFFTLFEFSAKWDPIPTILTQNHSRIIKGFMGQTTAFNKNLIKSSVIILGENKGANEAKYIHGKYGKGMWSFYGGHDPEDYQHRVGDPQTELDLYPNSPGYRIILNNILFPAARKKKLKT